MFIYFLLISFVFADSGVLSEEYFKDSEIIRYNSFHRHNVKSKTCNPATFNYIKSNLTFDGTSWTLTNICSFIKFSSPVTLSWHFKGKRLQTVTSANLTSNEIIETLIVKNVTENNIGTYNCLSTSCDGFDSKSVIPEWDPIITANISLTEAYLPKNSGINVSCLGYPGSTLFWVLDEDVSIKFNSSSSFSDKNLNTVSSVIFNTGNTSAKNFRIQLSCCDAEKTSFPYCYTQTFKILSDVKLYSYETISLSSSYNLSCKFVGFPQPKLISWSECSKENCSKISKGMEIFTDEYFVVTTLNVKVDPNIIYQCSTIDEANNQTVLHQFNFNNSQILLYYMDSSVSFNGTELVIECEFISKPAYGLEVMWIKTDVSSNISSIIKNSTETIITLDIEDDFRVISTLKITNYAYALESFVCKAYDNLSQALSMPISPHISLGIPELIYEKNVYDEGELVEMSCILKQDESLVLHPLINVNIISEFDVNYTLINNDDGSVNVSFVADTSNTFVRVQCESVNTYVLPWNLTIQQIEFLINYTSKVVSFQSCTPEDFENGNHCDLICTVKQAPEALFKNSFWNYFAEVSNTSAYIINEGTSSMALPSPYLTNYTLTLSTYYAGHYQCLINFFDPLIVLDIVTHLFKIDHNQPGSRLNENCSNHTQCLAYQAVCDSIEHDDNSSSSVCLCKPPASIPLAFNESTSACLSNVGPGDFCYNSLQCQTNALNFNCTDNICQCDAFLVQVEELNNTLDCRMQVGFGEPCLFNIDCELYDQKSSCINGNCWCMPGYEFKDYKHSCGPVTVWSAAAISGFVIGGIAVLVLVYFFISLGRNKWRRKRVLSSQHLSMDSNDLMDDEELDFSQLNSFVEFPIAEEET